MIAWKISRLTLMLLVAFADDSNATEAVSFSIPETNAFGWCQMCTNPSDVYGGGPVKIQIDGIDIIQSARLVLDMGPFIIESASFEGLSGDFDLNVEREGDLTIVVLLRISTIDINQASDNIILHDTHSMMGEVGLGYGALRILSAEVQFQTETTPEIRISDGSWYIATDYLYLIPLTVISSESNMPIPHVQVWLTGLDEWPELFSHFPLNPGIGAGSTNINGLTYISFMPAGSIFSGEIPSHPIILHVLLEPPEGSEFEARIFSVPVEIVKNENYIQFLPVTIDISAQTSAVTEWMGYR